MHHKVFRFDQQERIKVCAARLGKEAEKSGICDLSLSVFPKGGSGTGRKEKINSSKNLRDQEQTMEVWPLEKSQPKVEGGGTSFWPAGPALSLGFTHVGPKLSPTCAGQKSCWTASW